MQTYTRLQKVLLCLSHKRTLMHLDGCGEDHDGAVRKWCESTERSMTETHVGVCIYSVDQLQGIKRLRFTRLSCLF